MDFCKDFKVDQSEKPQARQRGTPINTNTSEPANVEVASGCDDENEPDSLCSVSTVTGGPILDLTTKESEVNC